MEREVIITLKGIQTNIENQASTVEFMTEAKFYKKKDIYYIVYKETQITGMDGTTTTIKVCDDVINLIRFGTICTNMVFKEGERYTCNYETTYGLLNMCICTNKVKNNISDFGGDLYVDYDVEVGGQRLGYNNFYIKIIDK